MTLDQIQQVQSLLFKKPRTARQIAKSLDLSISTTRAILNHLHDIGSAKIKTTLESRERSATNVWAAVKLKPKPQPEQRLLPDVPQTYWVGGNPFKKIAAPKITVVPWTKAEDDIIRASSTPTIAYKELRAAKFVRSRSACNTRYQYLKGKRPKP